MSSITRLVQRTKNRKVRFFVILGALQAVAVEQIVQKKTDSVDICLNLSTITPRCSKHCEMVRIHSQSLVGTARQYVELFRAVKSIRRVASELHVFIPHAYHTIANYLAFNSGADTLHLLPDGLLNYYDAKISDRQYRKMLPKLLVVALGGKYKRYRGNYTAMEQLDYKSHYVFDTRSVFTRVGERRVIPLPHSSSIKGGSKIFILDQPLQHIDPKTALRIKKALTRYLGKDLGQWIYKAHRDQKQSNVVIDASSTSIKVSGTTVAEHIIKDFRVGKIVGIYSSALITLKIMYPDLPCISVGANVLIENRPELKQAFNVMSDFGIEFIEA